MKKAVESTRKKSANIALSAEVLHSTVIPLRLAKRAAGSAASIARRGISRRRPLSHGHVERDADWVRRQRSTRNCNGDPVIRIFPNEGTDGYRASSTCTRGGSRQTRMYRS